MKFKALLICVISIVPAIIDAGPVGTAFTYQGQLAAIGVPANGKYDFTFNLYNTNSLGTPLASPVFALGVGVTNGLFDASLDFGSQFNGEATWLEISVRSNNVGNFLILAPRQQLTPSPNAIFASTASNISGTLPVSQLTGTVPLTQLPTSIITNNSTSVNLNGTFGGDGSGLRNTVTAANYIYAYDTTTQSPSTANSFQNVTFAAASLSGWTYSAGTFTCAQSGMYLVEYDAEVETGVSSPITIQLRAVNTTIALEIPGTMASITVFTANQPAPISKSFLAFFNAGDGLQLQLYATSTQAGLFPFGGRQSISCTVIRVQ